MQTQIQKVELRNLKIEDSQELRISMIQAYGEMQNSYWKEKDIEKLLDIFLEGQLVVVADDKVVGSALSLIVPERKITKKHTYEKITGNYGFSTNNAVGDILYGIDVLIHPLHQGLRLGRHIYDSRKEFCEQLNLNAIVFTGRIPNYTEHANKITPKEYIEKIHLKELQPFLNLPTLRSQAMVSKPKRRQIWK